MTYLIRYYDRLSHVKQNKSNQKCLNTGKSLWIDFSLVLMANGWNKNMSHQDGSEKPGTPQPTVPTSTPGHSHLLSLPSGFFFPTHGPIRSNGGEARKQAKRKTLWRHHWEWRERSRGWTRWWKWELTGGVTLGAPCSESSWTGMPLPHTGSSIQWVMNTRNWTLTHTRLANSHAPRHVHTMHAMQMCCLPCTHTTVFLYMQLEEEDLDVRDRVGKLHV